MLGDCKRNNDIRHKRIDRPAGGSIRFFNQKRERVAGKENRETGAGDSASVSRRIIRKRESRAYPHESLFEIPNINTFLT